MVQLISREEVFYKSWLVDYYISREQNNLYDQLGYTLIGHVDELSTETDPYDHLAPFHNYNEELNEFAVLAYAGKKKTHYLSHLSTAFIRFFELVNIKQLYLIDALKCNWIQFPFSYREKRDAFKTIVNQPAYYEALAFSIDELSSILPLFHHSRRLNTPVIYLFSVNTDLPFATFLCDDVNFHSSFQTKDCEKIAAAASAADLLIGGFELCMM